MHEDRARASRRRYYQYVSAESIFRRAAESDAADPAFRRRQKYDYSSPCLLPRKRHRKICGRKTVSDNSLQPVRFAAESETRPRQKTGGRFIQRNSECQKLDADGSVKRNGFASARYGSLRFSEFCARNQTNSARTRQRRAGIG